jgi:DNA-binding MarR family transcriptional regulator
MSHILPSVSTHPPIRGACHAVPLMTEPLSFDPIAEAARQWRKHWGARTAPPMRAVTSIMRAQQILLARLNAALEPTGLTFPRYEALMLLFYSRRGSLPLGKIGDRLQVHRTSVTNLIDGLERLGYATRTAHPTDRRTTLAEITASGRQAAEAATRSLNEMEFGTKPLTRSELDAVSETLARLRLDAGDWAGDQ